MSRNLELAEVPAPGQSGAGIADWSPAGGARCVCGSPVDAEAARLFGVGGVVPACSACWTNHERNKRYHTVTSAVRHFNDGTGTRAVGVEIDASAHPEVDG